MSQGDYNVPNGGGLGGGEEASIGAYVCAKYSYVAQQADELSFSKGDYIIVLEKSKDGWWKGGLQCYISSKLFGVTQCCAVLLFRTKARATWSRILSSAHNMLPSRLKLN